MKSLPSARLTQTWVHYLPQLDGNNITTTLPEVLQLEMRKVHPSLSHVSTDFLLKSALTVPVRYVSTCGLVQ